MTLACLGDRPTLSRTDQSDQLEKHDNVAYACRRSKVDADQSEGFNTRDAITTPTKLSTLTQTFVLRQYAIPAITKSGAVHRRTPPEHQLKNLL